MKWIDVNDKLPEAHKQCLVSFFNGFVDEYYVTFGYLDEYNEWYILWCLEDASYEKYHRSSYFKIKAWMYCPETYKEECE